MTQESAVQFEGVSRIHMGLAVRDLERSVAFYTTLFGAGPTKTRPGYAKFEMSEPRINLSLNQVTGNTAPVHSVSHFGVQVKSMDAVRRVSDRLSSAEIATRTEEAVTCCYAVQNKVWADDPDGNPWEVYVVLDNDGSTHAPSGGDCCQEGCCDEATGSADTGKLGDLAAAGVGLQGAKSATSRACGCPAATAS